MSSAPLSVVESVKEMQLEIIDFQCDSVLQETFKNASLKEFYSKYLGQKYLAIKINSAKCDVLGWLGKKNTIDLYVAWNNSAPPSSGRKKKYT